MRRNIHVMYKNFRGIVLTKTLLGFEGRLNPAQLKEELESKNVECSLVVGWSLYEPDEAIELTPSQAMEAGKCVARKGWITTCFVVKQIDSDIPAEVVPKMQSLPQHAKNLLNAFGVGSISYRSQCLLVEQAGDGNGATNYVPDWVDMFAKDWFVLGGE